MKKWMIRACLQIANELLMNKVFMRFILFFICICLCGWIFAEETPSRLQLKGHLGQEELEKSKAILEKLKGQNQQRLIVEIQSTSGDLVQVLEMAKTIYEIKVLNQLKVIVYIDDNAIGPAAVLPFLADELYTSLFVSWGDIPLGSEGVVPTNLLRNRIRSLINPQIRQAPLLSVLADAMSDPNLQVIDEEGWRIVKESKTNEKFISVPGQTLVVNQTQLKDLGLVQGVLPRREFEELFDLIPPVSDSPSTVVESQLVEESSSDVEKKFQNHIRYHQDRLNLIGYIYVGDRETSISQSTWIYIKNALDYYKQHRPIFIILELNTPGGEVFAAQKISDALKNMDTQENIPIVTFINNWAISAGAMLAYSTRFITATKDASMGAAEPVLMGESGKMEAASEKVNSAIRADFANRARFFDRNPYLAEAMVDKDAIIVLRHGKIIKLDNEKQVRTIGPDPDVIISPKGKLLTLDAQQMLEYGVANLIVTPEKLTEITSNEKKEGKWPASKMLLFRAPFFSQIPQATIDAYQMDWKTQFFVFLATPLVSSLLFMGLIIGAYLEMNHPGLSLPGILAGTCLFLMILSSFSLEITNWLELILLLTGFALILVEVFILPSFGLVGVLGILLFIAGLFGMMLPGLDTISFEYDTQTLNAAGQYFMERLGWLSGALLMSLLIIVLIARFITPTFAGFKRFVLSGHEQDSALGYVAGEDPQQLPQPGTVGKVLATLRPTGKIIMKDRIYNAMSTGDFIDANEPVVVVRLEGSVIVVKQWKE